MLDCRTVARAFRIAVWRSLTRCCPPVEPAWLTALSFFSRMSRTTASRWFSDAAGSKLTAMMGGIVASAVASRSLACSIDTGGVSRRATAASAPGLAASSYALNSAGVPSHKARAASKS